ncbi:hypothetical protein H4217_006701, partial [Coemansia sp. RSA 1939]
AVIVSRQWKQDGLSAKAMAIIELLKPIHSVYPDSYKFAKDSVYYDTKANPDRHLKAYYLLMRICEREKVKANQCFPLHTSWVPGHMQIDTRILHEKFVSGKLQGQKSDAELIWREVLDYDAKLIKTRANSKFGKSIMTDGVSVSVLRMDHQKLLEGQLQQDNCPYMENISSTHLSSQRSIATPPTRRPILSNFYVQMRMIHPQSSHPIHQQLQQLQCTECKLHSHPLHCKLRLSAYINQKQADAWLAHNLWQKFGKDCVLVMGNWPAPMAQFHKLIRGKGMHKMLQQHGFQVYLLDEYCTSKICPACIEGSLTTFKHVQNPRPYQRKVTPEVKCHGLLSSMLNFRHILNGLCKDGFRPARFM